MLEGIMNLMVKNRIAESVIRFFADNNGGGNSSGGSSGSSRFDINNVNSLNDALDNIPNRGSEGSFNVTMVFNWVYAMAALVAVGYIVYGAIMFGTSEGSPEKIKKATSSITYAIIGLVIVMVAWALTAFVLSSIT